MGELWSLMFAVSAISAAGAYALHCKPDLMRPIKGRKGKRHKGEVTLGSNGESHDYESHNRKHNIHKEETSNGRYDHLFRKSKETEGKLAVEMQERKESQMQEIRLRDTTGLTSTEDIPKLREDRLRTSSESTTNTTVSPTNNIWEGRSSNSFTNEDTQHMQNTKQPASEEKKEKKWTPMAFFSDD